jgi:long-subunit fatty acid transport protein
MRKILTFSAAMLITGSLFAGGLVTNTNQSAYYTRMQNRNASTSVDAVYYNPAGVTKLGNGFFASINNQTISQTQTVTSTFPSIAGQPKEYTGKVSAPLFPGIYVAYNMGNFSVSAGFNPIGGGGGAEYAHGLPVFESQVSVLPGMLTAQGIPTSQYSADIFFKGSSVYFGYQLNLAYKINDMVSVAAGVRMVTAKNTYNGYMKNISINPNYPAFGAAFNGSAMVKAADFFTAGASYLTVVSTQLNTTATSLQPIITGGGGSVLLSNGTAAGLTSTQVATLQGTITALGGNPTGMTIAQSQQFFAGASATYGAKASVMSANASATQDLQVDAEESGTGFTPILSANIAPTENLNIAVRYEFQTKLNLTTTVNNNLGGGLFEQGAKVIADMPAMLALGVDFKPIDKLLLSGSFNTYFDKNVDYDGSSTENVVMIDKNFLEYGLGAEYAITDKFRISAGWVATVTGVNDLYQDELSYDLNTNSFGGGIGYRINDMIDINLGGMYTLYKDETISFNTYDKKTWLIGAGLDFFFGK